jgi:hypothetical protein
MKEAEKVRKIMNKIEISVKRENLKKRNKKEVLELKTTAEIKLAQGIRGRLKQGEEEISEPEEKTDQRK